MKASLGWTASTPTCATRTLGTPAGFSRPLVDSEQVVLVAPATWPAGTSTCFDPLPGRGPALQERIVANETLTASRAGGPE